MFDESSPRPENLSSQKIELSENQRTTAAEILDLLNKHVTSGSTKRLLIFLESFSGAGKSALLKSLNPQLESLNAKILEPTPGQSSSIAIIQLTQIHRFKGNLVFPVLPQNLMAERKNLSQNPNLEFAQVSLKFMSKSEIVQLLEKSGVKPLLPMEKIAEYSLGIPGLAIKIASHADTDAAALMIVVNHFKGQIKQKDSVNKLKELTTGESQLSLDTLSQDYNILSYLNRILENSERLGLINTEVSPYFVAPESVALYSSKAEIKEITYDIGSVIMAYNISPNILPEFENSFLPDSYTQTTRRLRMFGAECHKIDIFELDQDGRITPLINSEQARQNDIAADFLSNNSPQLPKDLGNQTKVFFSAGDHGARHNSLELRLWAIESFLQQYGIQYVVKNVGWRNKNYKFNPQTGHLEFFDKDEK